MTTRDSTGSRRRFLKTVAAGIAVGGFAPALARATQRVANSRVIPRHGEALPVVGLGTSRTFDMQPAQAPGSPLEEVMRIFFENGGQLIDSSPMYGNAEAVTGALLDELRIGQQLEKEDRKVLIII